MQEKVKFGDWFDVNNIEHLKAYAHVNKHASWPEGFIPDHVEMESLWAFIIAAKMANQFVAERLTADVAPMVPNL